MRIRRFIVLAGACLVACPAFGEVTFGSLLREMTDLDGLTRYPEPAYTCKQFSSYDRRSTDPAVLTDENWFANGDCGNHLRVEQRDGANEHVMMDADGPGALVRIWSANPGDAGIVRIYLDGAANPVIEMALAEMLWGASMPFIKPIACEASKGWNCYLPIPYAKHCKITASKPDFYYHVNYRTYPAGTPVQTYAAAIAKESEGEIGRVAQVLARPDDVPFPVDSETVTAKKLAPGESCEWESKQPGGGAVCSLRLRVSASDVEAALRGCLIEIAFDDLAVASVQAPVGDFFGTAPGINKYQSLPCGVSDDGLLYARWVMPFKESARYRLTNHSGQDVAIECSVRVRAYEWTERSLYFHAKWRAEYPIATQPRQDWTYVACKGKGIFVGDMLHVTNSVKDWWGEGDEKIYVDGESFPSHFGTGSEDYYGYAWCCNEPFTHAYHNQPRCDGPGNYGQTCVSRFHILDNIPFTTSFKFDIEVWHWADCAIAMAATSYWYATGDTSDSFAKPDTGLLKVIAAQPLPPPKKVASAIEGESLKILSCSGGTMSVQEDGGWGWSGAKQLWWRNANPGDTLELSFASEQQGRHEILAVFTKAADYGIAQIGVNGEPAGQPIDFFNNGVVATGEISLGTFDLRKGDNTLEAKIVGANEKAVPARMFGLDYLRLKRAGHERK